MSDDQRFSGPESDRPFGMPAQRTPVVFDAETGGLRIGEHVRRVQDPSEPTEVYGAYLSLLYAVRGAKPGEQLPLRAADLEALLLIVGDDPETIEKRLIGLMGCTAEEAKVLGGILLRHRKTTAALGVAASLLLGGSLASGIGSSDGTSPENREIVQSVSAESGQPSQAPSSASPGTAISGTTSPTGTSVVLAPASGGGGRTTTASAPVTGQSSPSTGGVTAVAVTAAPARTPRPSAATAPVVAEQPATGTVAEPTSPVEVEPVDRDLPPTDGRPISGTVGGEDGDGDGFEEPVPVEEPNVPVELPVPRTGGLTSSPHPGSASGGGAKDVVVEDVVVEDVVVEDVVVEDVVVEDVVVEDVVVEDVVVEDVVVEDVVVEDVVVEDVVVEDVVATNRGPNEHASTNASDASENSVQDDNERAANNGQAKKS